MMILKEIESETEKKPDYVRNHYEINNEKYIDLKYKLMFKPPPTRFSFNKNVKMISQSAILNHNFREDIMFYSVLHKRCQYIDIFCCFADIISIIIFYFDHFDYINNDFNLQPSSFITRTILLCVSVFICCIIQLSYYYKKQRIKILHLIGNKKGLRNQLVKLVVKNTSLLILLLECLVHLVQPYPGIKFQYKVDFIGIETMFNINMLFFFLGSLRIYTLIKDNSKNILYFFDKFTNNNMFFFKSNLKQNGLITLAFIGSISLFYFSLIFQILEYSEKNLDNPYYYYVNSLWFLIVTMCTGYGDLTPGTFLGRIVAVICTLIGIIILSVLVYILSLLVNLGEDESMAYNEIVSLGDTNAKKLKMENYMTQYILCKYKYIRKRVDINTILKRRQVDMQKKQIFIDLKKKYTNKYNMNEFKKNCLKSFDEKKGKVFDRLTNLIQMKMDSEELNNLEHSILDTLEKNLETTISIVNLANCISTVGGIKRLKNLKEVQSHKIIEIEKFNEAKRNLVKTKIHK